ncbi:HAD-IIB family hydrolase [Aneurinibacillus sp. Ricciae_BoGa-3]|uniref:HAD-IIB family hydrolase n=1 Tax=Aneurinibacillus sp. Ricciae_BoGa-3 TaxID=3022697 RepID=UPI0023401577|nr:HAD-IIB family hydrolase [Aneurinibacillus sp. Ricciae_BoGa-3]WCK55603.1 HAD-IIB family hydrolase [Aneurinibacillus sp. Ricciae_BoGa-3]
MATDLDGTLVGDPEALSELIRYFEAQTYNITLIYSTGRHLASALSLIEQEALPQPEILITDVGTEIYERGKTPDSQWQEQIEQSWYPEEIKKIASTIDGLIQQHVPSAHRVSFTVNSREPVTELAKRISEAGIPHELIYSSGIDVDILPPGCGKGAALEYLIQKHGWQDANILVAGDSGNDKEMLTLGYPAVIVGNAQEELRAVKDHPAIYCATRHCAGGIYEAWNYFHGTPSIITK